MSGADDTIFALASGGTRAGIAVLRLSGQAAGDIADAIAGSRPAPRRAALRRLRAPEGATLDHGMVLWFPGPASYTGEDCCEFHVHGGSAVVAAVSEALRQAGARPAAPGEFTRRAFINGRVDLVEAEGIGDLIEAETDAQRRQALSLAEGALSAVYAGWAARLRHGLAVQEALIDFPDESEAAADDALAEEIGALADALSVHLVAGGRAERLRRGVVICVAGAPNVGKSSLMNRLAERDVSIVSPRPGTTRDAVEARGIFAGVPVTLIDTAGIRESADEIEAEGVRRAQARAAEADLVLHVVVRGSEEILPASPDALVVENKCDLQRPGAPAEAVSSGRLAVSARTGENLDALRSALEARVAALAQLGDAPVMTRARHRDCLETARNHLLRARAVPFAELRGEELRLAMRSLGRLTGEVGVEDLLDTIFSTFCIGK